MRAAEATILRVYLLSSHCLESDNIGGRIRQHVSANTRENKICDSRKDKMLLPFELSHTREAMELSGTVWRLLGQAIRGARTCRVEARERRTPNESVYTIREKEGLLFEICWRDFCFNFRVV